MYISSSRNSEFMHTIGEVKGAVRNTRRDSWAGLESSHCCAFRVSGAEFGVRGASTQAKDRSPFIYIAFAQGPHCQPPS